MINVYGLPLDITFGEVEDQLPDTADLPDIDPFHDNDDEDTNESVSAMLGFDPELLDEQPEEED